MTKTDARPQARQFPHFDAQTVASQGNAILGIRDSGKSYTAIKIAEMMYDAGIPFVAFDPIGRWRFMRVPGTGHGYPVVVAGGMAADLPLTAKSAPEIVRAAMQAGVSLIIDLYDIQISKSDWRKIVGEAVRVLLYENGEHGLRHIFIEEAAEFAPQRVGPESGAVYAEIEKLARMGGNARLGYTLINQRAEEVNKAVLELCDNLFLHRQKGRNSLNALSKWLDLADVQPGSKEIIKSLPTLPQGECWAWMAGTDRPVHIGVPAKNSWEPDRRAMRGNMAELARPPVNVIEFVDDLRDRLAGKSRPTVKVSPLTRPGERILVQAIPKEADVKESEARALREANAQLTEQVAELQRQIEVLRRMVPKDLTPSESPPPTASAAMLTGMDEIFAEVKRRLLVDPGIIRLLAVKPEIDLKITRRVIEMDGSTPKGRVVGLLARGFFDNGATNGAIRTELKRTGPDMSNVTIAKFLDELVRDGFVTRENDRYQAVGDMKVNIREAA